MPAADAARSRARRGAAAPRAHGRHLPPRRAAAALCRRRQARSGHRLHRVHEADERRGRRGGRARHGMLVEDGAPVDYGQPLFRLAARDASEGACSCPIRSHPHAGTRCQRGQWSLVGLLVSLAIIAILSAWYYAKILKPQAGSHNGAPAAEQKAYGSVCSEYQSQLNRPSTMYKQDHNDRPPRTSSSSKSTVRPMTSSKPKAASSSSIPPPVPSPRSATGKPRRTPSRSSWARPRLARRAAASPRCARWSSAPRPPECARRPPRPARGPGGITLPPGAGGSVPAAAAETTGE